MKQIVCELCNGREFLKQDGVFVCQTCNCKYSVEEVKKMMTSTPDDVSPSITTTVEQPLALAEKGKVTLEGVVDVSGSTVKVDHSERLKNLYQLARRAKNDNNAENAEKYYDMILIEDPTSWEAAFYVVYLKPISVRSLKSSLRLSL